MRLLFSNRPPRVSSGSPIHDRHMKSTFEFAVIPGLRASARLIHAPGTLREIPPDNGSLTRALDCDLTHPCASSPLLRRRLLGAMAEVRAHDPAAAWRCAQRPSPALEAEVSGCVVSRVQGYYPRHRTNSCSDTPSAGRRGVTRARAQVRTLKMTWAARAGATSPASRRVLQVRHQTSDREGSGRGLCRRRSASEREMAVGYFDLEN